MTGIADILYVRFRVPDLEREQRFLDDFGMVTYFDGGRLLARGTDASPYLYSAEQGEAAFLGLGFEALSEADFERIAAIDGAEIEDLDAPGGGRMARLEDPDGLPVDLVYGIDKPESLSPPERQPMNFGNRRGRLGERVAFKAPAQCVKRLGHCVINVADFRASEAWYKQRFGFITSDEVYIGSEERVLGAFMRCNRGERYPPPAPPPPASRPSTATARCARAGRRASASCRRGRAVRVQPSPPPSVPAPKPVVPWTSAFSPRVQASMTRHNNYLNPFMTQHTREDLNKSVFKPFADHRCRSSKSDSGLDQTFPRVLRQPLRG